MFGSIVAMITEILPIRIDDNLTIPLLSGSDNNDINMNFLNPIVFWLLGFILVPIIIHFINQFNSKR